MLNQLYLGFSANPFPDVQADASEVIANSDGHRTTPVYGNFDIDFFLASHFCPFPHASLSSTPTDASCVT